MNELMFTFLYIDPGTGSMLFTIVIGIVAALTFALRGLFLKAKLWLTGGAARSEEKDIGKKKLVIFGESKRYNKIFAPILDELEKREFDSEYWTADPDDPILSSDYSHITSQFIGEGNKAFVKLNMLKANICLATTPGLDVYQWKRSKYTDYYVHCFHSIDDGTLYRMFGLDHYDAVLAPGQFTVDRHKMLEKIGNLPAKEFVITGTPYIDELAKRLESAEKAASDRRTIVVAPSWGKTALLAKYGEELIDALISTGYNIIIRPHPQSKTAEVEMLRALEEKYKESDSLSWDYSSDNFNTLNKADFMISDFSGVIIDFSLVFDKPFLYANEQFDKAPYDAAWLEEEAWTFKVLPELGTPLSRADFPRLKELIDNMIEDKSFSEKRTKIRAEALPCYGKSAELIAEYLINKYENLTSKTDIT